MPLPFVPFTDVAEIVFNMNIGGKPVKVIISARNGGSITVSNLTALLIAVVDYLVTALPTSGLSSSLIFESLTGNDLTTSTGITVNNILGTAGNLPQTGGAGGAATTNQVALVATLRTGLRGRSYRGRVYWPGIPVAQLASPSSVLPIEVTAINNFTNGLLAAIVAAGWTPVVCSRQTGGVRRLVGVATPIIGADVDSDLDTQRRRLVRLD